MGQKIIVEAHITMPLVPNFFRLEGGDDIDADTIDVADITDMSLAAIGKQWTDDLLANAAKRRKDAKKDTKAAP